MKNGCKTLWPAAMAAMNSVSLLLIYLGICIFGISDLPWCSCWSGYHSPVIFPHPFAQHSGPAGRKCSLSRFPEQMQRSASCAAQLAARTAMHRYYRCRGCGAIMRVPRGAGKLRSPAPSGRKITKRPEQTGPKHLLKDQTKRESNGKGIAMINYDFPYAYENKLYHTLAFEPGSDTSSIKPS